jgi:hypothetical protein
LVVRRLADNPVYSPVSKPMGFETQREAHPAKLLVLIRFFAIVGPGAEDQRIVSETLQPVEKRLGWTAQALSTGRWRPESG